MRKIRLLLAGPTDLELIGPYLDYGRPNIGCQTFPYIARLALSYVEAGHEVHIVCLSDQITEVLHFGGQKIKLTLVPQRKSAKRRAFDLFAHEREGLRTVIREISSDAIHAHWTYEYAAAALSVDKNALVSCHDSPISVIKFYHHPYWLFREALSAITLRRAHMLTAVSPSLKAEIGPFVSRTAAVTVVPNGIKISEDVHIRRQVKDRSRPVFCTVANGFNDRKNSKIAIQAFNSLRVEIPEARLILIGEGHERGGSGERWCIKNDVETDGIEFYGVVENSRVLEVLRDKVDIVVHTSRWEACCIAIMEAQSLGRPVIGGRASGGVSYSLADGRAGLLVDIRNSASVSVAMRNLVKDPALYSDVSRFASSYVLSEFDFESVTTKYVEMLSSLSARGRS